MDKIKSRASFYVVLGLVTAVCSVICVLFAGVIRAAAVFFGIIAGIYWCVYFYSISYELSEGELMAQNGFFIRKTRKITLSEVVLESKISMGKTVLVTVLRTAGGSIIVFGGLPGA